MMKTGWIACLTLCLAAALAAAEDGLKRSVVKIFTVTKPADYYQPWQLGYQQQGVGSGLVLDNRHLLTNAHVVSDQVHLQVLKAGDTRKVTAKVLYVAHDCELAMLTVEDPDFFKGTVPVTFGDVPRQRDRVAAYGFPAGGDELSITEGVVSRVEVQTYLHSQRNLLTIQTDAAINPGNSGGPVFKDGRCIGISFQSFSGSRVENTGYIIPVPIIRRFLKDVEDGTYDGVPSLGVYLQKIENASLRAFYRLPRDVEGMAVTKVVYGSPADGILKEGDVLTAFDGVRLAGNGTIPFREGERVYFTHLLSRFQMGQKVALEVWREGAPAKVEITFKPFEPLVLRPQYDVRPSYFVFGGLVFMPLSYNYIQQWGWNQAGARFRSLYESGLPSAQQREVVFINQVLPHEVNAGYHKVAQAIVTRINGKPIGRMKDVIEAVREAPGGFHVVEVDHYYGDPDSAAARIVLKAEGLEKANEEILKTFGIPADRSEDLRDAGETR